MLVLLGKPTHRGAQLLETILVACLGQEGHFEMANAPLRTEPPQERESGAAKGGQEDDEQSVGWHGLGVGGSQAPGWVAALRGPQEKGFRDSLRVAKPQYGRSDRQHWYRMGPEPAEGQATIRPLGECRPPVGLTRSPLPDAPTCCPDPESSGGKRASLLIDVLT